MRRDLKLTLILTPLLGLPIFVVLAFLWNPHGSGASELPALVGWFGMLPYLFIASELRMQLGALTLPLAILAQLCWTAPWIYGALRLYRVARYLTSEPSSRSSRS
jgi:hypothetical protein